MTTLVFEKSGYDVATQAWTAWASSEKQLTICYVEGADGISVFSSATGTCRAYAKIKFDEFLKLVKDGGVVDLRQYQ